MWRTAAAAVAAGLVAVPGGGTVANAESRPLGCVPAISTLQVIPPLPGLFLPLPSIRGVSEFDDLPAAPAGLNFPPSVDLRDNTQGFNSFAEVALRDGSLYTRPRTSGGTWRKVPTPGCLDGQIVAVSVDGNMLVAADRNGWIYSMDNLLSGPMLWNWTYSYGGPIWLWPGEQVPGTGDGPIATSRWAISHRMSKSFEDAKGYTHPTTAGLVELVALSQDGSRITYQDPWLPADLSYEIGGPMGGRFVSEALSVSGSVTFVMNKYGDMFTRKYDLDMAGSNHIPGRYTWQDQGPLPSAPDQLTERFNPAYAAISLPAQDWQPQPKIPGEITSRISIHVTGDTAEDRELRVEGRSGGRTGYWHKDLRASAWEFTADDQPLEGSAIQNSASDMSAQTLVAPTGITFQGGLPGGWRLRFDDFDWAQTEHPATLTSPTGRDFTVQLYTTDGLRLLPRAAGLDDNPRELEGALDVREANPADHPELQGFVDAQLSGKPVVEVTVQATRSQLTVAPFGATLIRN
ncbi:hypothetical protein [Nocardia concava]|uniref:hypothetical protein n=1 Tax=Nocardia concava TaxID=257281 RepID=UPI0003194B84|nr:hypothetical protein [Nocardia concava]